VPYPSEHAARIEDPDDFDTFRRKNSAFGPGIDVIFGVAGNGPAVVQSIRFDREDYTPKQARAWLRKHGYDPLEFEPATGRRANPGRPRKNAATSRYTSAHWGIAPDWTRKVEHPEIPNRRRVIQMGELLELEYRGARGRLMHLSFDPQHAHLGFLPDKSERLIILTAPSDRRDLRALAREIDTAWEPLPEVAAEIGGRQARFPSADVAVKCIGQFTRVVYRTDKEGDGVSDYVHRMGEEGGIEPMLCVDANGYLYAAGGSYRVPDRGIIH